jgi:site-specific DNA recombinase
VPHERTLAIDEPRAQRVREIFDLYMEVGGVRRLKLEMDVRGWRTPERQGKRPGGGRPFTHGHLYRLLSNPIYIGKISHKGVVHPGQHQAIVTDEVWRATQVKIAENTQGHSDRIAAAEPSLLAGLLQDGRGRAMMATHAKKGNKRYRYYCTEANADQPALRMPAQELEKGVQAELVQFLQDQHRLLAAVPPLNAADTKALFASAVKAVEDLKSGRAADRIRVLNRLVAQVKVHETSIEIGVREAGLHEAASASEERVHWFSVPAQLKRGNHAMRLVLRDQATEAKVPDPGLVALLARANRWFDALRKGQHGSIASLAEEQRQDGRDVTRTVYLAFLAPDIVDCIARGEQPVGLGVQRLLAMAPLPMDWEEQRKVLGLA